MVRPAPVQHVANHGVKRSIIAWTPLQHRISAGAIIRFGDLLLFFIFDPKPRIERKAEDSGLDLEQILLAFFRGEFEDVLVVARINAAADLTGNFDCSRICSGVVRFNLSLRCGYEFLTLRAKASGDMQAVHASLIPNKVNTRIGRIGEPKRLEVICARLRCRVDDLWVQCPTVVMIERHFHTARIQKP